MITVRKATQEDDKDFTELELTYFLIFFGYKIKTVLQYLYQFRFNLFSFEHVYFAEVDRQKAGMILGYDWQAKKRENLRTVFLVFKKMGISIFDKFLSLMKFNATVGRLTNSEYYISNIAVYPHYKRKGVGKRLMLQAEQEVNMANNERIVLDVKKENLNAITFYKEMGYKMILEFAISLQKDKILHFVRMTKEIK